MLHFHPGRSRLAALFLALLAFSAPRVAADDESQAKQRLELMQAALGSLELEFPEPKPKAVPAFASTPLLRYNDPTRGGNQLDGTNLLLDAGVWRLGTEGRPTALVTVEVYQTPDKSKVLAYEFLSLSDVKFSLKHKKVKIRWDPAGSGLKVQELPDAPKPAATAAARLVQMRELVRRFGARENVNKELIECRLLTQPIDRYKSEADRIADGAIFALANGTNPEVGIVLESDGERWRYGTLRLSAAEVSVTLDGKEVAAYEHFNSRGRTDAPYHNGAHKIEMGK